MNILKFALIGAAVAYGINYLTKIRDDGTTVLDDLTSHAPDWMEKATQFATETVDQVKQSIRERS